MRRVASHFVYWKQLYRMYYVELSDEGALVNLASLVEEIAGTEFYDGILLPFLYFEDNESFRYKIKYSKSEDPLICRERAAKAAIDFLGQPLAGLGEKVALWSLQLSASEFGTDDGCSYCYIQRL